MQEITWKVEGIACTGCENRIENALNKIEGIVMVKADHEIGTVTIKAEENLISTIQKKIEDLGFTIIEDASCKKSS